MKRTRKKFGGKGVKRMCTDSISQTSESAAVRLTCDLGASTGKFFWEVMGGDRRQFVSLPPMVTECSWGEFNAGTHRDKSTAYVRWHDRYWIAGANAVTSPHKTIATERKIESAGVRIAAAVAIMMREVGIDPKIELRVLLPLDEIDDRDALTEHVMGGLYGLGCDGVDARLTVASVDVYPEGRGLLSWVKPSSDPSAILIFGHRDLTALWVEDGAIVKGKSHTFAGMGFLHYLQRVGHPFKSELDAARYVSFAGAEMGDDTLLKLVSPSELYELKGKLADARGIVGRAIAQKLNSFGLAKCGAVLASGGSSFFWSGELKTWHSNVGFCEAQAKTMMSEFGMKKTPMLLRSLDAYGIHTMEGC